MENSTSTNIVFQLKDIQYRITNASGHKHLYKRFEKVYNNLKTKDILEISELNAIADTIILLTMEARVYSFYSSYSLRCMECAEQLNFFVKDKTLAKDIQGIKEHQIRNNIWDYFAMKNFQEYVAAAKNAKQYGAILDVIKHCFLKSDSGRRPRVLEMEIRMYELIVFGHDLLEWYLLQTNDISCFSDLDNCFCIFHLQGIYEAIEGSQWTEEIYCIKTSIERHLNFYQKWIELNAKSFLEKKDETFIHELLEMYDDNTFFFFLEQISCVLSDKSRIILEYYTNDDEVQIRNKVEELLKKNSFCQER